MKEWVAQRRGVPDPSAPVLAHSGAQPLDAALANAEDGSGAWRTGHDSGDSGPSTSASGLPAANEKPALGGLGYRTFQIWYRRQMTWARNTCPCWRRWEGPGVKGYLKRIRDLGVSLQKRPKVVAAALGAVGLLVLIALGINFFLSLDTFAGETINVGGDYGWGSDVLGFDEYRHTQAYVGQRLNFTSAVELGSRTRHDVWELPSEKALSDCDFNGAKMVGRGPVVKVYLNQSGERFFACSANLGLNCHDGQKIHVTVLPRETARGPAAGQSLS